MPPLREADLEESFSLPGGPGGQHADKASSAVVLRHIPTGLRVSVSGSRSQWANRIAARKLLEEKIAEAARVKKLARLAEAARDRRRKAKRSRAVKAKLVDAKRRRSATKKLRGRLQD